MTIPVFDDANKREHEVGPEVLLGTGEVLGDRRPAGDERPWRKRKRESVRVAAAFRRLGEPHVARAARCRDCGTFLTFCECPASSAHPKSLHAANFCRERLCGMCAWRRSLKIGAEVRAVVERILKERPNATFILLTLTIKNCSGKDLRQTIDLLQAAWSRFHKMHHIARVIAGSFRSLEVTCSRTRGDYHPHLHVLIETCPDYFAWGKSDKSAYMSQQDFATGWQQALQVEYKPVVHVQRVRDVGFASCEVAKYAVKPADIVDLSGPDQPDCGDLQEVEAQRIGYLHEALSGRRLVTYTGTLRAARQALIAEGKIDPEGEDGDLIHVGDEEPSTAVCKTCGKPLILHQYEWGRVGATWDDGAYVG